MGSDEGRGVIMRQSTAPCPNAVATMYREGTVSRNKECRRVFDANDLLELFCESFGEEGAGFGKSCRR